MMNTEYNQKKSITKSLLWATLFLVILFLVILYIVGANVEKQRLLLKDNISLAGVVVVSNIDLKKFDKDLDENTPLIIKEFYELNNSKFSFPAEEKLGWQESDGVFWNGAIYDSFFVESSVLVGEEPRFARDFLEARGFMLSDENSRNEENRVIQGFMNRKNVCILYTFTGGLVYQKLSCTSIN